MIAFLILLAIFLQYFFIIYSIYYRKFNLFSIVYIIHIFFYDYLFINASYYLPSFLVDVLKPLNEYLFLFLIGSKIIKCILTKIIRYNYFDKLTFFYFIFPSFLILLIRDIGTGQNLFNTIQGLRIFVLPVFIPYLIYKKGWLYGISYKTVCVTIIILSLIAVAYGCYQRLTFSGDVSKLWFADFFKKLPVDPVSSAEFDFIRNDVLRTTSFFVSPIIYSYTISIAAIVTISMLFKKNSNVSKMILAIILLIFIYGLMIAETRVGSFNLIIGVLVLILSWLSKSKDVFILMLCVPVLSILLTFLLLLFGYTDDLSALGRIVQYSSFFDFFKWYGTGFSAGLQFDTFYMSIGIGYGILGIPALLFFFKINFRLFLSYHRLMKYNGYFYLSVLVISLTFIYSFAFQFTAGSFPYRLLLFLVFIVFSNSDSYFNNDGKIDNFSVV